MGPRAGRRPRLFLISPISSKSFWARLICYLSHFISLAEAFETMANLNIFNDLGIIYVMEKSLRIHSFRIVSWKIWLVIAGIFGTLAFFVLASAYPIFPGDEWAISRLQDHRTGWMDDGVLWLANVRLVWVFILGVVALSGGLFVARRFADVAVVLASLPVVGIGFGLKLLVDRPRPEYQILGPIQSDPSFPSGHALLAIIIGGLLVYFVERSIKLRVPRRTIQIGLTMAVLFIGASRVYMGVHWPSDVIGSYLFGVMALVGLVALRNALSAR